jgi:uncharacterized membrane protein YhaH (DUF805 family)
MRGARYCARDRAFGGVMGLFHYLFSFSGRINRAKQWAVLLVSLVHVAIIGFALSNTIGFAAIVDAARHKTSFATVFATPQAHLFGIIFLVLYVIGFYIGLAVTAKRLHDRNKSAWWLFIFIILPFALQIPAIMFMPTQFAHLAAVIHAAQAHQPVPPPPLEPPTTILLRGVAVLISLWAFVELYLFRGTVGENRYGPDPLA